MKTPTTYRSISVLAGFVGIATATAIAFSLSLSSGAADAPTKGAERLMQFGAPALPRTVSKAHVTPTSHAACGDCRTVKAQRTPEPIKGAQALTGRGAPATFVSSHGCGGCTTTIGVSGHGKAKAQTVTHGCSRPMLASANCCE